MRMEGVGEVAKTKTLMSDEMLREAVDKGYKDVAHMKKDKDLDALRGRGDFQKLLVELEAAKQEE